MKQKMITASNNSSALYTNDNSYYDNSYEHSHTPSQQRNIKGPMTIQTHINQPSRNHVKKSLDYNSNMLRANSIQSTQNLN